MTINKLAERLINELNFKDDEWGEVCGKKITRSHRITCKPAYVMMPQKVGKGLAPVESETHLHIYVDVTDIECDLRYDMFETDDINKVKELIKAIKKGTWEDFE